MQDIGSIGGGGGQFLGGGGDLSLRPHHQQNHLTLKCPRCDSLNTKFCYFNNYNHSQPRHYCKSCRRYWTKGGVLRNIPVGGGCRKSKRSKLNPTSDAPPDRKSNSHSTSETSSPTAATTAASAPTLHKFRDSMFFHIPQIPNSIFDPPLFDQSSGSWIFPEFGSFTSMMTSSQDPSVLGFNIADVSTSAYRLLQQNNGAVLQNQSSNQQVQQQQNITSRGTDELKMKEIAAGFLDQTAQLNFSGMELKTNNGGIGALDLQAGDDQFLFDLTAPVDQTYWSHSMDER